MVKRLNEVFDKAIKIKFSHGYPKGEPWWEKMPIALLVRDPRDVIVSHFFQITKRRKKECPESISDFIRDPKWGIDNVVYFYNEWHKVWPNVSQRILLTYENLQKDCYTEFGRLLRFFSIAIEDDIVRDVVNHCSFDNMRQIEHRMSIKKPNKIGYLGAGDIEDFESYKVRRGKIGGYVDYLSTEDIKYLEERIEQLQGYEMYKGNRDGSVKL